MTIERALEIGAGAAVAGGATALSIAKGTRMDQWVMWALSSSATLVGAYVMFRVTTEHRLTTIESAQRNAATQENVADLQGQINVLAADGHHRREVMERMDQRLEKIAAKLGVM